MAAGDDLRETYARRFARDLAARRALWQVLCEGFFQRHVPPGATVLELGAGYCEFSNAIRAARRIAVDLNPDTARHAAAGVEVVSASTTDMGAVESGTVDVVFASNFFEHLTREDIVRTVREAARVLRPGGRIMVLQPNIRYCYRDYWMFFDHVTPLDDRSLAEVLEVHGFRVLEQVPRFLPFTTKSRLPQAPWLVRLYLRVPLAWRVLGAQAFVLAESARAS